MKIDPNAPAFPNAPFANESMIWDPSPGLTIRAEIAKDLMVGIMANPSLSEVTREGMAKLAVDHADALIAELNRTSK